MLTQSLQQSEPASTRVPRGSVLFALTASDRETFMPDRILDQDFESDQATWVDPSEIDHEEWEHLLVKTAPEVLVTAWGTPAIPERYARQAELPLRYVCHMAGALAGLVPRILLERGVSVSNWGNNISHTIAEHAILLTLGGLRNAPQWGAHMRPWPADRAFQLRTQSLRGKRVGLHGFGAIAREIVAMLKPFQVKISAFSEGVPPEWIESHGVKCCETLGELFSTSDVLIECEALNQRSIGSVTGAILDRLHQDALFVNVGRGAIVDECALIERAMAGKLRIALDVFVQEPPPPDYDFFRIPNAFLSPHIAGPTADAFSLCGDFAIRNVHRFLRGEPVEGLVSLEAYDRMV